MNPISDLINKQYQSGKALVQSDATLILKRNLHLNIPSDLFPATQNYYHRLNPCFIAGLQHHLTLKYLPLLTLRDGAIHLASFLLTHFRNIPHWKNHFIIHRDLAPLVPENLREHFSVYEITQARKIPPTDAKKVIIFGSMIPQYLGTPEQWKSKLEIVKGLGDQTEIQVFFPMNKNPFEVIDRGAIYMQELTASIQKLAGPKAVTFLQSEDFVEKTNFKGTYLLDLAADKMVIADSYVNYMVASRGGTVSSLPEKAPADHFFEMDLSFYHKLYVSPFPQVDSIFADLFYHKKQSPGRDALTDSILHEVLQERLKKRI